MEEREKRMLDILAEKKYVSTATLCKALFASESTIRRDLNKLEDQGLIRRTRGGAFYVQGDRMEWPLHYKNKDNIEKKRYIADLAIDFVRDNAVIFMDSSSTSLYLAKRMHEKRGISVITNGLTTANLLSEETDAEVYCTGGKVYSKRSSVHGMETCTFVLKHTADIAFTSCRGLDAEFGASDFSDEEAMVKQCFQRQAKQTILLADSSKFNKRFFKQTFLYGDIHVIISDMPLPEDIAKMCDEHNVEVVY